MAAVFDLDLETEEGSEGEGEPEFSPAVSVSLRVRLDPGAQLDNQSLGAPYSEWFVTPTNPDPAPVPTPTPAPTLAPGPDRPFSILGLSFPNFPHPCCCLPILGSLPWAKQFSLGWEEIFWHLPWFLSLGFSQDVCPLGELRAAGLE